MKTRNSSRLFSGMVFDIEQFDAETGDNAWHTYQVIRHPGGVGVLPLHADGTITLIRQPRPAIAAVTLELPAGRLGSGETPEECGRRELVEETGLVAGNLHPLGCIHSSPGVFDEVIHLYAATGLTQQNPLPDDDEEIEPVRIPLAEALEMARDGRINDAKTIVALFRTGAHYR
jgi:ADP-ribose pyrophosphatase